MIEEKHIILSIKPKWANLILSGEKKVELRRTFSKKVGLGTIVIIYASAPVSAIIGTVKLKAIESNVPENIWKKYGRAAMTTQLEFSDYFKGKDIGVALIFSQPVQLRKISLETLRKTHKFTPPVSWRFLKEDEYDFISGAE